jgi:A/G-specific adenine glycosylase
MASHANRGSFAAGLVDQIVQIAHIPGLSASYARIGRRDRAESGERGANSGLAAGGSRDLAGLTGQRPGHGTRHVGGWRDLAGLPGHRAGAAPYSWRVSAPLDRDALVPPALREAVLAWYAANGRPLAFRATSDPYAVLVSELMAQQTQAERAAEAWVAWVARWPTVADLAAAPVSEVLRAWAGLGYNRRALALHGAARAVVDDHDGRVPDDVADLERLPGVGPYTARAVAAIAFGRAVGAVDTNVRRVLGRVAAGGPEAFGASEMQALADAVVPPDRAAAWTHALMDIGAGLCAPRDPRCGKCPASRWCRYAAGQRAPSSASTPAGSRASPPFPSTNRWLRGRVLDRARSAEDGSWCAYPEAIGTHPASAVREAVLALAREGLLEARETPTGLEARLPA